MGEELMKQAVDTTVDGLEECIKHLAMGVATDNPQSKTHFIARAIMSMPEVDGIEEEDIAHAVSIISLMQIVEDPDIELNTGEAAALAAMSADNGLYELVVTYEEKIQEH